MHVRNQGGHRTQLCKGHVWSMQPFILTNSQLSHILIPSERGAHFVVALSLVYDFCLRVHIIAFEALKP